MNRDTLKALQAPLKLRYQTDPSSSVARLHVTGAVDFEGPGCRVNLLQNNGHQLVAGLHPMAGGDGSFACSGDLLLQALVTCAGTTLAAVAISLGVPIASATIDAAGEIDFRGTLGVDRSAPVGFTSVEMVFRLATDASPEQVEKLVQLTERYCVVYQTLCKGVSVSSRVEASTTHG